LSARSTPIEPERCWEYGGLETPGREGRGGLHPILSRGRPTTAPAPKSRVLSGSRPYPWEQSLRQRSPADRPRARNNSPSRPNSIPALGQARPLWLLPPRYEGPDGCWLAPKDPGGVTPGIESLHRCQGNKPHRNTSSRPFLARIAIWAWNGGHLGPSLPTGPPALIHKGTIKKNRQNILVRCGEGGRRLAQRPFGIAVPLLALASAKPRPERQPENDRRNIGPYKWPPGTDGNRK